MKKYIIGLACMTCAVSSYAQEKAECEVVRAWTLEECVNQARSNNRTLRDAALEIKASNEQVGEMRAKYLPEISANVMAFQAFDKIIKADGTYPEELAALAEINPAFASLAGQPYSFHELNRGYSAMLSVMQPLYAGGQITGANRIAKVGREISELQYSLKEKDVVQKVTENYWQIAQLRYNLHTIEAAEKQLEAVYKKVNDFVETGVTTRNALLQVRLRRQELASQRLQIESASRVLTMLLAQQIGLGSIKPEQMQLIFPEQQADVEMPVYVDSYSASLTRMESQLANKAVEANEIQIKLERGKLLPTLAVGVMGDIMQDLVDSRKLSRKTCKPTLPMPLPLALSPFPSQHGLAARMQYARRRSSTNSRSIIARTPSNSLP